MGRKSTVLKLPQEIRAELACRVAEQPALTIDQHQEWLSKQGYRVSRSALHRHLQASQQLANEEERAAQDAGTIGATLRLGCLMVAAGYSAPGDKTDLIRTANELTDWVNATSK